MNSGTPETPPLVSQFPYLLAELTIIPFHRFVIIARPRQANQDAGLSNASPKTSRRVGDRLFPRPGR